MNSIVLVFWYLGSSKNLYLHYIKTGHFLHANIYLNEIEEIQGPSYKIKSGDQNEKFCETWFFCLDSETILTSSMKH